MSRKVAPSLASVEDVDAVEQPELVAGHEIGVAHEVGRVDGLGAEPQVRNRHGARLLGVVHEVALHEGAGRFDDDLGAVLVGADGAV